MPEVWRTSTVHRNKQFTHTGPADPMMTIRVFFWFVSRKMGVEISPKTMRFWEDRMFFWRFGVWFFDFESLTSQYPGARGIYVVWGDVRVRKFKEIAKTYSGLLDALAHYINTISMSFKIFGHTGPFWWVRIPLVAKHAAHDGIFTRRLNRFERFPNCFFIQISNERGWNAVVMPHFQDINERNPLISRESKGPTLQCHL